MYRTSRLTAGASLVAAITAVTLGLSGCAGTPDDVPTSGEPAGPSTDITVALSFTKTVDYAGYFLADHEGYYEDAGVTATFLGGGPNAPAPEVSLSSGEAQIAIEANTNRLMSYLSTADDIVIIGQQYQRNPSGLLSLADRPVTDASDLTGARVIAGSANEPAIDAMMQANDVSDFSFVPGGADVGPLINGDGDALLSFATNQPITLSMQYGMVDGEDYFFTPFSDLNYNLMSNVVIVSKSFLESNRDAVVAFLAASIKGWNAQIEDPEAGAVLTVDDYGAELGLNLDQQIASAKAGIPFMQSDLTESEGLFAIDPDEVEAKVYPSLELGGLTGLPAAADIIDVSVFVDAAALAKG